MADGGRPGRVEVVRDHLTATRADELLAFWAQHAALPRPESERRLREVVSVLLEDDVVVGVSSVFTALVPVLGGRRYYVHRCLVPERPEAELELAQATFAALDAEFDPAGAGPIGLCLLLPDVPWVRARPEAMWTEPRLVYAGYTRDGRQVRVDHFAHARVGEAAPRA